MPQQTEPSANNALGELLAKMLPGSVVRSEHTQVIVDHPGLQPDILVTSSGRSPVVVEAEYMPAYNAESEARDRLGLEVAGTARHIDAAIALRYPAHIKNAYDLPPAISDAHLSYCVLYSDGTRFPESGWLDGSVEDLSDLIRLVSVPQRAVDQAADASKKASTAQPRFSNSSPGPGPESSPPSPNVSACPRPSRPTAWPELSSPTPWSSTSDSPGCTT